MEKRQWKTAVFSQTFVLIIIISFSSSSFFSSSVPNSKARSLPSKSKARGEITYGQKEKKRKHKSWLWRSLPSGIEKSLAAALDCPYIWGTGFFWKYLVHSHHCTLPWCQFVICAAAANEGEEDVHKKTNCAWKWKLAAPDLPHKIKVG